MNMERFGKRLFRMSHNEGQKGAKRNRTKVGGETPSARRLLSHPKKIWYKGERSTGACARKKSKKNPTGPCARSQKHQAFRREQMGNNPLNK